MKPRAAEVGGATFWRSRLPAHCPPLAPAKRRDSAHEKDTAWAISRENVEIAQAHHPHQRRRPRSTSTRATSATPEQVVAGLTDFGPGRSKKAETAPTASRCMTGRHQEADVTEGSGGIWERRCIRLDRSRPRRADHAAQRVGERRKPTTLKRNPDGTTEVDYVVVRDGKSFGGGRSGSCSGTIGKRRLESAFEKAVKAIEARDTSAGAAKEPIDRIARGGRASRGVGDVHQRANVEIARNPWMRRENRRGRGHRGTPIPFDFNRPAGAEREYRGHDGVHPVDQDPEQPSRSCGWSPWKEFATSATKC